MTKKKNHAYFLLCNLSSNHHFAFLHANLTERPGEGGKLCQLSNVCFIQAEFCRFDRFTSYTGQHWETQLPTAPLQQPQKHDFTICLFVCLRCVWLSLKNVQWLKITLPPFLGSVSSSTFSSKLLSVGKPSKCLVRIHVSALIMMLCCRAEERNDRLKHSLVPVAMGLLNKRLLDWLIILFVIFNAVFCAVCCFLLYDCGWLFYVTTGCITICPLGIIKIPWTLKL